MSRCPNCYETVQDHPQNGCVLAALIQVVRERGSRTDAELLALHADANVDAMWDDIGPIIDRLEDGAYTITGDEE